MQPSFDGHSYGNNNEPDSKSNGMSGAVQIPEVNLPKGGGAIKGIDEKFEVNTASGTSHFSIGLPFSPGRNGFDPGLELSYNSGSGNSAFGLGWSIDIASITLKTELGLPKYQEDEDIYQLTGVEDLVPYMNETSPGVWEYEEKTTDDNYFVKRYRPRIEGSFSKLEKISHEDHGTYWKHTTGDNVTTIFGRSAAARIANPEDETQIFQWLAEFSYDDKGNWIKYFYKEENLENVPNKVFESHRHNGNAKITNQYLKRIKYGNKKPYYIDESKPFDPIDPTITEDSPEETHLFEVVFDYGEHNELIPTPTEDESLKWNYRPDAFSSYRSGFEVRTNRLCERVLLFHKFEELGESPCLVKSTKLNYEGSDINAAGGSEVSYLVSAEQSGYIRNEDNSYSKKSFPLIQFDYQTLEWSKTIQNVSSESIQNAPEGLTNDYQWVDLYNEGISGILYDHGGDWYYKENQGDAGGVQFSPAKQITNRPSISKSVNGDVSILDIGSNGEKHVAISSTGLKGSYKIDTSDSTKINLKDFTSFKSIPNVDWSDPNTRYLDLSGDGRPDIVLSQESAFVWYPSEGTKGFSAAEFASKGFDEKKGPAVVFENDDESIFLADITGDGLTDIVRIRNGEICYWANKGYGRFSAQVIMGNAPVFDHPDQYNPGYLHLADVSGTGAADIIYLGKNKFKAFINNSGNSWSDAHEIDPFAEINNQGKLSVIDLLGTGTSCIVWSSELPGATPMQYIDLMSSKKPHVLVGYQNNLGREVSFEYKSSTHYYLKDKKEGKPWITKLPFPVQVVSKVRTEDKISETVFVSSYSYHHGYFDPVEREFRGFGRVDQLDTEQYETWSINNSDKLESEDELYQSPVLTKSWFHVGSVEKTAEMLTAFESEFWHEEIEKAGFPVMINEHSLAPINIVAAGSVQDSDAVSKLSPKGIREAQRSNKGSLFRKETFALDADESSTDDIKRRALIPYTVVTQNGSIQLLQPDSESEHGVFQFIESESITFNYERNETDPRIVHNLNIKTNELGMVEESAIVVYPRQIVDGSLSQFVKDAQDRTSIVYTRQAYTNDVLTTSAHRLRMPSETEEFELNDISKLGALYSIEDFEDVLTDNSNLIGYEVDLINDSDPFPGQPKRRLIEHIRILYLNDELNSILDLHLLESKGLLHEKYQLAYTTDLLTDIYDGKITDVNLTMSGAGYTNFGGDSNWWIRSGTMNLIIAGEDESDARSRFYLPVSYTDPLGSISEVEYYQDYFLHVQKVEDALNNTMSVVSMNLRTLQPSKTKDQNDTISEVLIDELGMVKARAIYGKDLDNDGVAELQLADELTGLTEATEAEQAAIDTFFAEDDSNVLETQARTLLQHATQRFVYNLSAYSDEGKPIAICSISRETHHNDLEVGEETKIQISFEYMDGSGGVIMTKSQAEPGVAKRLNVNEDETVSIVEVDTSSLVPQQVRWIGNGRRVINNKGKIVKQFEPYFSVTPFFEDAPELVERGVSPIIYYDPLGRITKTEFPDSTFSLVEVFSWKQLVYDQNDTVQDSEWYTNRVGRLIDAELVAAGKDPEKEEDVAIKTADHHGTPTIVHFDTLGQEIATVSHNKDKFNNDLFHHTEISFDIERNVRVIFDAKNNVVVRNKYSMLADLSYLDGMDSGKRWMLNNVVQKPIQKWDSRDHIISISYDALHRPLETLVTGGDGTVALNSVVDKITYGEGQANDKLLNLRGAILHHYDTAGKLSLQYDQKGNITSNTRSFTSDYKSIPNWDVVDPSTLLENESFTATHEYDALNREILSTTPDGSSSVPSYNERNLLDQLTLTQDSTSKQFVKGITYNEKGAREQIKYGNGLITNYQYDAETFRLLQIESKKSNGKVLQELHYTFDPVGNVSEIEDKSIPTTFFGNYVIKPVSKYKYDALYQLVEAEGREHAGQQINFGSKDNYSDDSFLKKYSSGDSMSWRNYTQSFEYDGVGNIQEVKHVTTDLAHNWTREYAYDPLSNRLLTTKVGGTTYNYSHHSEHGFMTKVPHLSFIDWNFRDELRAVSKQLVNSGVPEITYYVYDASGQRIRKVTENASVDPLTTTKKSERFYLDDFEVYRKSDTGLERTSIHISDDTARIAMIDTRNDVDDGTDKQTVRYQLSNHIKSASIELDENASVISYEEYHPFGTTAYQAVNKDIKASAKRYRYTGMERDEESGLSYHSARYYLPWLGRWLKCDPAGLVDGTNLYRYGKNNPVKFMDQSGNIPDNAIGDKMFDRMVGNVPPPPKTPPAPPPPPPPPSVIYSLDKSTGKAVLMTHAAAQKALGMSNADFTKAIGKGKVFIYRNGRLSNTSQATVDQINDPSKADPLMAFAIKKLQADTARFKGKFPSDYYVEFSKAVMKKSIALYGPDKGVTTAAGGFGSEDMKLGYAALHLYEGLARSSSSTGFDKVQHFVASADLEYSIFSNYSLGVTTDIQQYGKEIFYDEIPSWFSDDIGYDSADMLANNRGQAFGAKLYEKYHPFRNNPAKATVKTAKDAVNNTLYEADRWIRWYYNIP